MAKASITLSTGTVVNIEGSPAEIKDLLAFYGSGSTAKAADALETREVKGHSGKTAATPAQSGTNLAEIANLVKSCDEAEEIERNVLDRNSQVDRILLPLFIVHEHLKNAFGLSSGEISKIAAELGVPIAAANASKILSSTARAYVIGDKIRKNGQAVKYRLSRRGQQYMKSVISGSDHEIAK